MIEDTKENIIKERFGRLVYKGKMKVILASGESAFLEAKDFLKQTNSLKRFKINFELTVIPSQNERENKDRDDLRGKVLQMTYSGINIRSYWRDVIKDPELSFLLMIVDDNGVKSGKRRKDILNPRLKYIGI